MSAPASLAHHQSETYTRTIFGFWVYVMTDCILFTTLFVTYVVLHNNTFGGPTARDLFGLPFALSETLILLTSSFTCGLGMLAAHNQRKKAALGWLGVTFLLGAAFLALELHEFARFVQQDASWQRSAFLSIYFTLVGTHGTHITFGLLWILVIMALLLSRGLTPSTLRRASCLGLFWHFLDVVWIFIFTVVYLMGVA